MGYDGIQPTTILVLGVSEMESSEVDDHAA